MSELHRTTVLSGRATGLQRALAETAAAIEGLTLSKFVAQAVAIRTREVLSLARPPVEEAETSGADREDSGSH